MIEHKASALRKGCKITLFIFHSSLFIKKGFTYKQTIQTNTRTWRRPSAAGRRNFQGRYESHHARKCAPLIGPPFQCAMQGGLRIAPAFLKSGNGMPFSGKDFNARKSPAVWVKKKGAPDGAPFGKRFCFISTWARRECPAARRERRGARGARAPCRLCRRI